MRESSLKWIICGKNKQKLLMRHIEHIKDAAFDNKEVKTETGMLRCENF